jgi:hypothetical protein
MEPRETQSERLSFRATAKNMEKLISIAKAKGWVNSKGHPNVSAVLNYLIEMFDMSTKKEAKKKESNHGR